MTIVVTFESENRFPPGPAGMGAKLVQGHIKIEPYSAAIHAGDLHLNTIKALFLEQYTVGSFTIVNLVAPGTYDNYASLTSYDIFGTGDGGYPQDKVSGYLNTHFLAFGE